MKPRSGRRSGKAVAASRGSRYGVGVATHVETLDTTREPVRWLRKSLEKIAVY